jgi:hypothetical protein
MTYNIIQYHTQSKSIEDRSHSAPADSKGKQLYIIVCSTVVGLLVLYLFLMMGGIFAFLAPWVILAGIRVNAHKAGWQVWSCVTGIMFLCLGLAALFIPNHMGVLSFTGGLLALLCGLRYLVPLIL